jgi:hypothetical protein
MKELGRTKHSRENHGSGPSVPNKASHCGGIDRSVVGWKENGFVLLASTPGAPGLGNSCRVIFLSLSLTLISTGFPSGGARFFFEVRQRSVSIFTTFSGVLLTKKKKKKTKCGATLHTQLHLAGILRSGRFSWPPQEPLLLVRVVLEICGRSMSDSFWVPMCNPLKTTKRKKFLSEGLNKHCLAYSFQLGERNYCLSPKMKRVYIVTNACERRRGCETRKGG